MNMNVKLIFKSIEMRKRKVLILLAIASVFLLIYFGKWVRHSGGTLKHLAHFEKATLIVWSTPILKDYESTRFCGTNICTFSSMPTQRGAAKALLFYASNIQLDDMPLPRSSKQIWALLHEESPRNTPYLINSNVIKHFNITSTFSRYSDMPLTTQYLPNLRNLTSPQFFVPIGEKSRLRTTDNLAPIVFLQSNCDTMSGRDEYVHELMQFIDIDAYGKCLNNRELPPSLKVDYLENLYTKELLHFLARYKFVIAYENGICDDYITEKFWRPLMIGSIPVYFGSPSIKDWQPNEKSIINIDDFSNPKELADFIRKLDNNDILYNEYLNHKYNIIKPINNQQLLQNLQTREITVNDDNFFNAFECFVCAKLHDGTFASGTKRQATQMHYNCPLPPKYPPMNSTVDNNWKSILDLSRLQAKVIDYLLTKNEKFTNFEYKKKLHELINADVNT